MFLFSKYVCVGGGWWPVARGGPPPLCVCQCSSHHSAR
nr:MAG TPA: hypothetical protein [Caudoviricetes sp.]